MDIEINGKRPGCTLNKVMGMVCERDRYYYNAKKVDAVLAETDKKIRRLKRALYKACANWAMAESYSVLNDAPIANRWIHTLRKLEAKLEAFK